jgi:hypothetical protein
MCHLGVQLKGMYVNVKEGIEGAGGGSVDGIRWEGGGSLAGGVGGGVRLLDYIGSRVYDTGPKLVAPN